MSCKRCPHHVRHGSVAADRKTIAFSDVCGLKVKSHERAEEARQAGESPNKKNGAVKASISALKSGKDMECVHAPFSPVFAYRECQVYLDTFKCAGQKNNVIPTKDFQYSEALNMGSITDLELL